MLRLLAGRLPAPVRVELLRCYETPASLYLISDLTLLPDAPTPGPSLASLMLDYLEKKKEELPGVEVTTNAIASDAPTAILERAESSDLVLMASPGRGGLGRWLMGSVANKVTRGATKPVLVIGAKAIGKEERLPAKVERILVGLDGSADSERALQRAADIAHHLEASLILYRGVTQTTVFHEVVAEANRKEMELAQTYVDNLASQLRGLVKVETAVREAFSSAGIVEHAAETKADLIVVGSHGRSGLVRWIIGSQAERALHDAHCPVLLA
jgi:nucleotide-binding universal stress UspA family protein